MVERAEPSRKMELGHAYVPLACVAFALTHCFLRPSTDRCHQGKHHGLVRMERRAKIQPFPDQRYVIRGWRARGGIPGLWVHSPCACG